LKKYDPNIEPVGAEWLDISEDARIEMVTQYHRRHRVSLPNPRLHAVIHVIVENQLALGESPVVEALNRLQAEGLGRHDAIHAIGMVLSEHLFNALNDGNPSVPDLHRPYFERLKQLSADEWRRSGER